MKIKIVGIVIIILLAGVLFIKFNNKDGVELNTPTTNEVNVFNENKEIREGVLQGHVTIGPVCTKELKEKYPSLACVVTAEMYAAAHVLVYKIDKTTLIKTIIPDKDGNFSVKLSEGEYFIDMIHQRMGGTTGVPVTITISKDKPVVLKLNVDTGLR
jgi:hypothetical protein